MTSAPEIWMALSKPALALITVIFNFSIVWITIKNKNLQNNFGIMLAIYSLLLLIVQIYVFFPYTLILIGTKIPLLACFYASAFPLLWASLNSSFTLLFISLDRLIATLFPLFYQFYGTVKYILILHAISTGYILILIYFIWLYAFEHQEQKVYCELGDQFGNDPTVGGQLRSWEIRYTVTYSLIFVVYIFLGIYLKLTKPTGSNSQMAQTRRIFKSLGIIGCTVFGTYFLSFICILFLVPHLTNDPQMGFLYTRLFLGLLSIGTAIDAPALYFCSSEYRNAINRHFPLILSMFKVCRISPMNNNSVQIVQSVQHVITRQICAISGSMTNYPINGAFVIGNCTKTKRGNQFWFLDLLTLMMIMEENGQQKSKWPNSKACGAKEHKCEELNAKLETAILAITQKEGTSANDGQDFVW